FEIARFLAPGPHIGSFTANSGSVATGSPLTLTATNIGEPNPNGTISQVTFYYIDSTGAKQILGNATQRNAGTWTLTFTVNLSPNTYTIYAQAQDSFSVLGDPVALVLTVT